MSEIWPIKKKDKGRDKLHLWCVGPKGRNMRLYKHLEKLVGVDANQFLHTGIVGNGSNPLS